MTLKNRESIRSLRNGSTLSKIRALDENMPVKNSFRRACFVKDPRTEYPPRVPALPLTSTDVSNRKSLLLALLNTLSRSELLGMLQFVMSNIDQHDIVVITGNLLKKLPNDESCSLLNTLITKIPNPKVLKVVTDLLEAVEPREHSSTLFGLLEMISKHDLITILCEILRKFNLEETISLLFKFLVAIPEHDPIVSTNKILAFVSKSSTTNLKFNVPVVPAPCAKENALPRHPLTSSPKPSSAHRIPKLEVSISDADICSIRMSDDNATMSVTNSCVEKEVRPHSSSSFDSAIDGEDLVTTINFSATLSSDSSGICSGDCVTEEKFGLSRTEEKVKLLHTKMHRLDRLLNELEHQIINGSDMSKLHAQSSRLS